MFLRTTLVTTDVHKRLQQILVSRDLFGGRAVLLVGDLLQLPPVKAPAVFSKPRNFKGSTLWKSTDSLWSNFEVVQLETNFRQGQGNPWTECLNRFRIGKPTKNDIALLESRKKDTSSFTDATHLYYTNKEVNFYNTSKLNSLSTPLVEAEATYIAPPGYTPKIINGLIDKTQFAMNLQLKIGSRVMVILNIRISDSLVNGSLGTVVDFIRNKENSDVKAVVVRFDNPDSGREHMKDNLQDSQLGCPIYRSSFEYPIPYSSSTSSKSHFAKVTLSQFPLKLAWASTAHKVQGISIQKGSDVVLHGYPNMPPAMGYVMLSRSEDVNNVHLDHDFEVMQVRPNKLALTENARLAEVSIAHEIDDLEFEIYFVNVRSLKKHYQDVMCDIFAQRSSQICLAETWMDPNEKEPIEWKEKIFSDASVGSGKGCVVYSDVGTTFNIVKIANPRFQCIFQTVERGYQLVVCYLSSDCPLSDVTEILKIHLSTTMPKIIVGDFNFHRDKKNTLTKYLEDQEFKQIVKEPTHEAGNTLDHCYVSKDIADFVDYELHYPYFTDHCALCINLL